MQDLRACLFQSHSLSSPHQQALFSPEYAAKRGEEKAATTLCQLGGGAVPKAGQQAAVREHQEGAGTLPYPQAEAALWLNRQYGRDKGVSLEMVTAETLGVTYIQAIGCAAEGMQKAVFPQGFISELFKTKIQTTE